MNKIHVSLSTDDNYAPYCGVAIKSMLMNKGVEDDIYVYVLYKTLSQENINKLEDIGKEHEAEVKAYKLGENDFNDMPLVVGAHFTVEMYFRFAIPRMFPHVDRMVYLDCDVLVKDSLADLVNLDIDNKAMAFSDGNSGVLLINCDKWRKNDIERTLLVYVEENRTTLQFPDQEALVEVLKDDFYEIEPKWNRQVLLFDLIGQDVKKFTTEHAKIIHYIGHTKPWSCAITNDLVDEYFDYLKMLPWQVKDNRERNKTIAPTWYYYYLRRLHMQFATGKISKDMKILLLHDGTIKKELEYVLADKGFDGFVSFLFNDGSWYTQIADFIIAEHHNKKIAEYILDSKGYLSEEDYLLFSMADTGIEIDDNLFETEYEQFVQAEVLAKKKTYIILSSAPWSKSGARQRMHHIARALADEGQQVFYMPVCIQLDVGTQMSEGQTLEYILTNPLVDEGVIIFSAFRPMFKGKELCNPFEAVLESILHVAEHEVVLVAYLPEHVTVIKQLKAKGKKIKVIYECVDDHRDTEYAYWSHKKDAEWEEALMDISDAVTTTATSLFLERAVIENRKNVYLSRNAVCFADFDIEEMPPCPEDLKDIPEPRIFYMGVLYGRFDTELFNNVAKMNLDKSFVIIGLGDEKLLPKGENIYFLGGKGHKELKNYIHHMQVGTVPYKDNLNITLHCDPIKQSEHLACGIPTVATFMPDTAIGKPYSYNANTPEEFTKAINHALAVEVDMEEIVKFLINNSWQDRAALLMRIANDDIRSDETVPNRIKQIISAVENKKDIHPNFRKIYDLANRYKNS